MAAIKRSEANRELLDPIGRLLGNWMVFRDPPDHGRLRKLVHKAFKMAQDGAPGEEIVDWVVDTSVEAERRLQEAEERERRNAEEERARRSEGAGRGVTGTGIEPRPAREPGA